MAFTSATTFSKHDLPSVAYYTANNDKVKVELVDCEFKKFIQYQCQHRYKTHILGEDGEPQIIKSKVILHSKDSDFKYICFPFLRLFKDCKETVEADGIKLYKKKRVEITEVDSNDEILTTGVETSRKELVKYHEYK